MNVLTRKSRSLDPAGADGPALRPRSEISLLIAFVVLVSVVPSRLVVPGFGAAGRPASLLAIGLLCWWMLNRLMPHRDTPIANPIRWALFIYLLAHLAAVIAGIDRGLPGIEQRSMDRFVLVLMGIAGIVLVSIETLRSREDIERIISWVVALGAVSAAAGIVQFMLHFDVSGRVRIPGLVLNSDPNGLANRGSPGFSRAEGFTLHSIELGVVMGAILPMALHLASVRAERIRWYLAAVLIAGVIPMSISRTGVLAFVVGMLVFATGWSWRQRLNALVVLAFGTMVFAAITPGLLGTIRSMFTRIADDNSVKGRTEDFAVAQRYIDERPLFGRGPGTFLPSEYRLLDNAYLLEVIEAGWVGLISLLILLCTGCATAFWVVARTPDPSAKSLARTLGGAVAVCLLGFATYDAMSYPTMLGVLSISLGGIGALYRIERIRQQEDSITSEVDLPIPERG